MPTFMSSHFISINSPHTQASIQYQLTAEQQDWFDRQTPKEVKAPRLLRCIVCSWKLFRGAYKIYKEKQKGIQSMVNLITVKVGQRLLIYLETYTTKFLRLADTQVTNILDRHFSAIAKDMGTTKIATTIHLLPDIFSESVSEIHMKWNQRSDDTYCEHVIDIAKEGTTKPKGNLEKDIVLIVHRAIRLWQRATQTLHATSYILNTEMKEKQ